MTDSTNQEDGAFAREALAGYSPEILATPLVLLGAGALGSALASQLAMWGFTSATVVDADVYELSNATRVHDFPYARVAAGEHVAKAEHVAAGWRARLFAAGSVGAIDAHEGWLQELAGPRWRGVVLAAVDHPRARFDAVQLARRYGLATVMGGFDGRAMAVTVDVFAATREAACYRCATGREPSYAATSLSCTAEALRTAEAAKLPATPTLAAACAALMVQRLVDALTSGFPAETRTTQWSLRGSSTADGVLRLDATCPHHGDEREGASIAVLGNSAGAVLAAAADAYPGSLVSLGGPLVVYAPREDDGVLARVALPAWRCPRRVTIDAFAQAEADSSLVLDELDAETAERHGLAELPAAWFGWTEGSLLTLRDADDARWRVRVER
jgi:molybdopterin/thiamine biosynthesis adenylyltransferase